MKICPYCEAELSDTARKCKYCGEWAERLDVNYYGKTFHKVGGDIKSINNYTFDDYVDLDNFLFYKEDEIHLINSHVRLKLDRIGDVKYELFRKIYGNKIGLKTIPQSVKNDIVKHGIKDYINRLNFEFKTQEEYSLLKLDEKLLYIEISDFLYDKLPQKRNDLTKEQKDILYENFFIGIFSSIFSFVFTGFFLLYARRILFFFGLNLLSILIGIIGDIFPVLGIIGLFILLLIRIYIAYNLSRLCYEGSSPNMKKCLINNFKRRYNKDENIEDNKQNIKKSFRKKVDKDVLITILSIILFLISLGSFIAYNNINRGNTINDTSTSNITNDLKSEFAKYYCRGIGNYLYEIDGDKAASDKLYNECLNYKDGIIEDVDKITYDLTVEKPLFERIGREGVIYCIGWGKYAGIDFEYSNNSIIESRANRSNDGYKVDEMIFFPGMSTSLDTDELIVFTVQSCFGGIDRDISVINKNLWEDNYEKDSKSSKTFKYLSEVSEVGLLNQFNIDMEDGEHVRYYKNGNISSIINYKNGKMDGPYITYFADGGVEMSGQYKNGNKDGDWYQNFKNGYKTIIHYDNGKEIGDMIIYTGELKKISNDGAGKEEPTQKSTKKKESITSSKDTSSKSNNKIDIQKENKRCSYDYPGTVYRESDGWCACPGDPKGTSSWNELSKSCYRMDGREINNWKEHCTNEKAVNDCAVGAATCPRECVNWTKVKPRSIEAARADLGI